MGNNLCKAQSGNRSHDSKSSVQRAFGRCMQICPSRVGVKKQHNWNKHIYETRPPRQNQPVVSDDGWKTITLPRVSDKAAQDLAPVPPPRKKRPSMLSLNKDGVKNGFKDVFGGNTPRRYSMDSIHNSKRYNERGIDTEMPVRNTVSMSHVMYDNGFTDFSKQTSPKIVEKSRKVLPKVGNKKSDKFFGENLSDLSDEGPSKEKPIKKVEKAELEKSAKDPIERFIEENNPEKLYSEVHHVEIPSGRDSLDRKADFLISMLDQYSKEPCYDGKKPVEEELIVPKKKVTKHICDQDEFNKHFHKHEKEESEKSDQPSKSQEDLTTPKKPQRNFEIYRQSQENLAQPKEKEVKAPIRRKKSINREDLPSPPARPMSLEPLKNGDSIIISKSQENLLSVSPTKDLELETPQLVLNLVSTKTKSVTPPPSPEVPHKVGRNKRTKRIISLPDTVSPIVNDDTEEASPESPKTEEELEKLRKQLKKSHSSNTFLTKDVMQEMKRRVLEYQLSTEYVPEDIALSNSDDSHLVQPTSKIEKPKKKTSNASTCTVVSSEADPKEENFEVSFKSSTETMKVLNATPEEVSKEESSIKSPSVVKPPTLEPLTVESSVAKSLIEEPPSPPKRRQEDKKDINHLPEEDTVFNQMSLIRAESNLENILESEGLDIQVISDVLDDIYDKTVLEEFQTYLENEGTNMDELMSPGKVKLPSKSVGHIEVPEPILAENHRSSQPNIVIMEQKAGKEDTRSIDSISDDGYTDLVKTHSKEQINSNALLAVVANQGRRESIVDVDNWFNNHLEAPSSEIILSDARKGRRGSDFLVGYDTNATFPFGRTRHDSESSEFFEHRAKSTENLKSSKEPLKNDHSSLLKFIVDPSGYKERESELNAKNRSLSKTRLARSRSQSEEGRSAQGVVIPSIKVTDEDPSVRSKDIKEKLLRDSLSN